MRNFSEKMSENNAKPRTRLTCILVDDVVRSITSSKIWPLYRSLSNMKVPYKHCTFPCIGKPDIIAENDHCVSKFL